MVSVKYLSKGINHKLKHRQGFQPQEDQKNCYSDR